MDAKETIDSIIDLDGVYGAFFSSHADSSIIAKVPQDYPADVLQYIAHHGEETLELIRTEMKDCHEVRMDMGHISILMFLMPGGIMFAMIYKQKIIEVLRNAVYGICQTAEREHQKRMLLTARINPAELAAQLPQSTRPAQPVMQPVQPVAPKEMIATRYQNEVQIGEGGTAEIFSAYDSRLKRKVALKRFKETFTGDTNEAALAELESASRIQHHNVVSTFDSDVDEHGRYIVMEYIDGLDLEKLLEQGPLDLNRFSNLAIQCLEGLSATHDGGLLHLDLKPSNIMVSNADRDRIHAKLIDYGQTALLAENPKGHGLSGSIYHSSPEYLSETPIDERADLYSLGCVFYQALTGKRPFEGESVLVIMSAHIRHDVEDISKLVPSLPQWLSSWVMSLIACDATDRPRTAEDALEAFMQRGVTKMNSEVPQTSLAAQA